MFGQTVREKVIGLNHMFARSGPKVSIGAWVCHNVDHLIRQRLRIKEIHQKAGSLMAVAPKKVSEMLPLTTTKWMLFCGAATESQLGELYGINPTEA